MALSKEKEKEYIEKVKQDGLYLKRLKKSQTEAICLEAVKQNGEALYYVREQTPQICLEAVKQTGWALRYVDHQTPEICLEAIKEDGYTLQYVRNQTEEICLEAVKQDGKMLEYAKLQTEEIQLSSLFGRYKHFDLYEIDNFYGKIKAPTKEIRFIYELLKDTPDFQLPSYQEARLKLALKEIRSTDSPYEVLEQLYLHP